MGYRPEVYPVSVTAIRDGFVLKRVVGTLLEHNTNGLGLLRANSSSNVWNVNNDGNLNNNNPSNTYGFRPRLTVKLE